MRLSLRTAAAVAGCFASLTSAQSAPGSSNLTQIMQTMTKEVPQCALTCIMKLVGAPTSPCSLTDFACVCTNVELQTQIIACAQESCTVREQLQTQKFQMSSCGAPVRNAATTLKPVIWVLYAAAVFAVICRLIARLPVLGGQLSWDDYTIIACLLALTPCSAIAHLMVEHGLGQDIWMLDPDDITNTLFFYFIEMYQYTFLVVFTKLSILLLYLRIFPTKTFTVQCYCMIALVSAFGISCVVSTSLYCKPLSLMWTMWDREHEGTCLNINAQTYAFAGINMSLDVIIFVLPIPQLLPLQMSWKKKAGIALMFSVGLFVTVCSVVRLHTMLKWGMSMNPTYDYTDLALWSLVEIDIGVICACMPGVAGLLSRMLPKVFGSSNKSDSPLKYPQITKEISATSSANLPKKFINKTTSVSIQFESPYGSDGANPATKSDEFELIERDIELPFQRPVNASQTERPKLGDETREYRSRW